MKLDFYSKDNLYIAYHSTVNFTIQSDKSSYTVSKNITADIDCEMIASLETCFITFSAQDWPVKIYKQEQLDFHYRSVAVKGVPGGVVLTPHNQYSELTFYPIPNNNYDCTFRAKLMLSSLSINDELSNVPYYYQYFMMLDLAKLLCEFHTSGMWNENKESMLTKAESAVREASKTPSTSVPSADLRQRSLYNGRLFWAGL